MICHELVGVQHRADAGSRELLLTASGGNNIDAVGPADITLSERRPRHLF